MAKKYTLIATSDTPSFNLAELITDSGTYTFVVAAKGDGYDTSNYSSEVKYSVNISGGTHNGGSG